LQTVTVRSILTAVFYMNIGQPVPPLAHFSSFTCSRWECLGKTSTDLYRSHVLPLSQSTALERWRKTKQWPNQWPGLILSSSITRLLSEGALFHWCRPSNTITSANHQSHMDGLKVFPGCTSVHPT